MAIAYSTAAATARLTAYTIATSTSAGVSIDGQTGFGTLVIGTSALSGATGVLATITLQKPSMSISGKVATILGVPIAFTPTGNGTAALAEFRDSLGNTVSSGMTVGISGSGANIIVSSTNFLTTIAGNLISGTITSP